MGIASSVAVAAAGGIILLAGCGAARAHENPAGNPLDKDGMQIMAVYLQPVEMKPAMPDEDPAKSDIHLEADIHATKDNKQGFALDAWIPYLRVSYTLNKKGSSWRKSGPLLPMTAQDGPHYGANIALDGPGAYQLVFHIAPPQGRVFMHHVDKETGVADWWQPFDYQGSFNFVGTGKKGGY